jgi:hypothetical protein
MPCCEQFAHTVDTNMMLYVVKYTLGGYAREDRGHAQVAGVFTDLKTAERVCLVTHGEIQVVALDYIAPGYVQHLKAMGL